MQVLHIGSGEMTHEIEAAVRKYTAELPALEDFKCTHEWGSDHRDEWYLTTRLEAEDVIE